MIRLYFNRHGDRPWSLDHGEGTIEYTVKRVTVRSPMIGLTHYIGTVQKPTEQPCAWVEFVGAEIRLPDPDTAEVF